MDRTFLHRSADAEDSIHHPINLGNPEELSVRDITRLVLEVTGSRSQVTFLPRPVDDPGVRRPDVSRARHLLGWSPKIPIGEGLYRTVGYFRSKLGVASSAGR